MKKWVWCGMFLLLFAATATAQEKNRQRPLPEGLSNKTLPKTILREQKSSAGADKRNHYLTSTGAYPALSDSAAGSGRYRIADPVIRAFNSGADSEVKMGSSGILGMPRLAYGLANGKIIFRNSGATTFGTSTGTGSVGTGSFPGSVGTSGVAPGVNGKSPYAGPGMYSLPLTDGKRGTDWQAPVMPQRMNSGKKQ